MVREVAAKLRPKYEPPGLTPEREAELRREDNMRLHKRIDGMNEALRLAEEGLDEACEQLRAEGRKDPETWAGIREAYAAISKLKP